MTRPTTLLTVTAALATATASERPVWCSVETWESARALVRLARRDVLADCEGREHRASEEALSVGHAAFSRWRNGGWLDAPPVRPGPKRKRPTP